MHEIADSSQPLSRQIELDGSVMSTRAIAHDYLQHSLGLPDYYGRNLDALYDVLSTAGKPMSIRLINRGGLETHLGDYAGRLIAVFMDAANENPNMDFHIA